MELVIDANIVFSALIKRGWMFDFIRLLSKKGFKLYAPAFLLDETNNRIERLMYFSKLNSSELEFLIKLLFKRIEVSPTHRYEKFLVEAGKLLPKHPKDVPYFALALSLNCAVWSNEKRLTQQSKVRVLSTQELKEIVGLF